MDTQKKKDNKLGTLATVGITVGATILGALGGYLLGKNKKEEEERRESELRAPIRTTQGSTSTNQNILDNENLMCPISKELMTDPYFIRQCGHTFQKGNIQMWVSKKGTCPLCNARVSIEDLNANFTLKSFIDDINK